MNPFEQLAENGYPNSLPIIPPDATISPHSTLHKRVGTRQDGRGKTPGVKGSDGDWRSFDWAHHTPDANDYRRWAAMGAGVGLRTGEGLIALDADTMDVPCAKIVEEYVERTLGLTPIRIGRAPKALYPFRTDGPVPYQRIDFGARDERGTAERIELLTEGRQFVALGTHPKTGQPYRWERPLVPFDELPFLPADQISAFMEGLRALLPGADPLVKEGGTTEVAQHTLRGDPALVAKAVQHTPNTSAHFATRESYLGMGYAIKAAVEDEQEAFGIWAEWCERWAEGDNEPDIMEADWRRMKPPYRRGAQWLYEQAENTSDGQFSKAEVWFENVAEIEADNPFAVAEAKAASTEDRNDVYPLLTPQEIISRPPPTFLVERHIPDVSVGFLYSRPGAGKSFLALGLALAIAQGFKDWHGYALAPSSHFVLYIASEGSFDLGNRIRAWCKANNVDVPPESFLVIERTIEFMKPEDIDRLLRTVRLAGFKPALVVVDTVSRAMPGADENLQKDMTLFVKACDRVRDEFACAVLGVHHAGKSGDMRGSTVLRGAGDFVFRLERKERASIGMLHCEKQKAAEDGWEEPWRFDVVDLGDGQSSLVAERGDAALGDGAVLTPDVAGRVLGAMKSAWDSGSPWSRAPQSGERYAVRRMVADFNFKGDVAEEMLRMWEAMGVIATETRSAKRRISGYKVGEIHGQAVQSGDIFD